jgi:putative FmdB family regulatory protein
MPFYEYECSNCKFYVEALQKISDEPLKKCPSCKKPTLQKLVSAPVFRLKGGGWYETDFKSEQEGKRNLVGEDKEPETKPDDAKKDKAEAAPAAKPEAKPDTRSDGKGGKKPAAKAPPKAKPKAKAKAKPAKPAKKSKR